VAQFLVTLRTDGQDDDAITLHGNGDGWLVHYYNQTDNGPLISAIGVSLTWIKSSSGKFAVIDAILV
jgi:hypothetical protein